MSVSVSVVDEIRTFRHGGNVISIEAVTGSPLGELPALTLGLPADDKLLLTIAIGELAERERAIILGAFASGMSQTELGHRLGLSQSQISKLMKKALLKIQRAVA